MMRYQFVLAIVSTSTWRFVVFLVKPGRYISENDKMSELSIAKRIKVHFF